MNIKIFLSSGSLDAALASSPRLAAILREREVVLEEVRWDGTTATIPAGYDDDPVIVQASEEMSCTPAVLGRLCSSLGHFVFQEDQMLSIGGSLDADLMPSRPGAFLDRFFNGS